MWTTLQTFFLDFAPCYSQLCLNSQPVKKCEGEKTKHEGSFVINFCFCFIAASPMLCTSKYYQKLSRVLRSFSLSQFSRLIIMIWTFIGTKITPHIYARIQNSLAFPNVHVSFSFLTSSQPFLWIQILSKSQEKIIKSW